MTEGMSVAPAEFCRRIPKAELHLHIEGTLEPEMMFALAKRNDVSLRFDSVEAVRRAYQFSNLQTFLDIYYEGAGVLRTGYDFFDLAMAYFEKAAKDGVRRAEIFFDPQTHTERGIPFATVVSAFHDAQEKAKETLGLSSALICCFLRHLPADAAMTTFREALGYRDWIVAVGLDSSEVGHPPSKFREVYQAAASEGFLAVAHAGEEGPPSYIWEALELGARRIDHGVRCLEDPALVDELRARRIPLTVCPFSNVKLRVVDRLEDHPLRKMLDLGLVATVNSDDPAYFGGYVGDNFSGTAQALGLGKAHVARLAKNSIEATFASDEEKGAMMDEIERFCEGE